MDNILASTSSPFNLNVGAGLTGTDGYGLSGALENRQLLATPLNRSRATNLTNLEIQNLLAEPTIVAIAQGNSNPPTARYPNTVTNGDFLLGGNSIATLVGDGLDEFTTWTFDLTRDADFTDLTDTSLLASAELTLTLKTNFGIETDGITIQGLGSIVKPIRELTAGEAHTITIDLLDYFSPDTVLRAIQNSAGKLTTTYQDDAIVSFAQLELSTFDSGIFTVGESGEISIDFLFDGGAYRGELAIFSLEGMGQYKPGSEAFIAEATRRALTQSELGYIVISDDLEGGSVTGALSQEGYNYNAGEYLGIKTFSMRSGDRFGLMLVPQGQVQEAGANPDLEGAKYSLFSMTTLRPEATFGQKHLADISGDGQIFGWEDLRLDGWSDRDYNDLVFRLEGAVGQATLLDTVINPHRDWRQSEVGQEILDHSQEVFRFTNSTLHQLNSTSFLPVETTVLPSALSASLPSAVNVTISRVVAIENPDGGTRKQADFYTKIDINDKTWKSGDIRDQNDISPNWQFSSPVDGRYVSIKIQIWDSDGVGSDEHVDIDPKARDKDLYLTYDLLTRQVLGDVYGFGGDTLFSVGGGDSDIARMEFRITDNNFDWFDQNLSDLELRRLARIHATDNVLSREEIISLLRDATDYGSVEGTELADLRTILSRLDYMMPEHVRVLANKVVNGDSANRRSDIGNLVAGSSDSQMEKLIGKWFLGNDLPIASGIYGEAQGSLFQNGISVSDIDQGALGNCYFLAALGAFANDRPSVISNMFIDNGDKTFTVRFIKGGKADYVTVNRDLPVDANNQFIYANDSSGLTFGDPNNELWVALAEKAYAQLNESGWIGQNNTNSYEGIRGGRAAAAMRYISGEKTFAQSVISMPLSKLLNLVDENTPITAAFDSHAYIITSYNSTTRHFNFYNPWGTPSDHKNMTWEQLKTEGARIEWSVV